MAPKKTKTASKAAPPAEPDSEMRDVPSAAARAQTGHAAQNSSQQATNSEDVIMDEADGEQEEFMIGDEDPDTLKIRILPGESDTAASYEFLNEDHTLGNALRYVIMKNPDVEFCGYSIPHPSDPKMNLRIQTYEDAEPLVSPHSVLEKGLDDLMGLCDVVLDKYEGERDRFAREGRKKGLAAGSG